MKKIMMMLALLLGIAGARAEKDVDYGPFEYQGFELQIPMNTETHLTAKEATLKNPGLHVGFSLKIEADKKASPTRAMQLCQALVRDMDVKQAAEVKAVSISGMQGAMTRGSIEGASISLLVLDTGGHYLKLVGISPAQQEGIVEHVIGSLKRK